MLTISMVAFKMAFVPIVFHYPHIPMPENAPAQWNLIGIWITETIDNSPLTLIQFPIKSLYQSVGLIPSTIRRLPTLSLERVNWRAHGFWCYFREGWICKEIHKGLSLMAPDPRLNSTIHSKYCTVISLNLFKVDLEIMLCL